MELKSHDFLLEDYKQKIGYLTAHFSRMWTRFNFFLTLETALVGGNLLLVNQQPKPIIGVIGILISLFWYVMGAQDRFLADFYRCQVEKSACRVGMSLELISKIDMELTETQKNLQKTLTGFARTASKDYVGRVERDPKGPYHTRKENFKRFRRWAEHITTWRRDSISTTHLAAWIPLISILFWVSFLIAQLVLGSCLLPLKCCGSCSPVPLRASGLGLLNASLLLTFSLHS